MVDDTIRLRDVVQVELEQLEQYGDAAVEFFHELSEDIRDEFTGTLETLLTRDLAAFQSQVSRSLATGGLGEVGGVLGGAMGDILGGMLPESAYGDVFGAAIGGALRQAMQDFARYGRFDLGGAVQSANRSGGKRLDSVLRNGDLPMSRGQRSAEIWNELQRGQRNL